jgi:hypothetical protein
MRLSEALQAINAAQNGNANIAEEPAAKSDERGTRNAERGPSPRWLAALDKLPPIRLPLGPAIPWRLGLPALVALVVLMGVVSRSASSTDSPGVQLPAQQTYPVQQDSPLFAKPQPTQTADAPPSQPQPQTLGVQDAPSLGFDLTDIGLKLVVVLALAYGSLMLLRRMGIGGSGSAKGNGPVPAMRVVSSLALAPNSVNLLSDLGDVAEDDTPEAASFFDVLKGKIGS